MVCQLTVMFARNPWTRMTGSGWAALGLHDQSLAPGGADPGLVSSAAMPAAAEYGTGRGPSDAFATPPEPRARNGVATAMATTTPSDTRATGGHPRTSRIGTDATRRPHMACTIPGSRGPYPTLPTHRRMLHGSM